MRELAKRSRTGRLSLSYRFPNRSKWKMKAKENIPKYPVSLTCEVAAIKPGVDRTNWPAYAARRQLGKTRHDVKT
jgi:hypothetical protein